MMRRFLFLLSVTGAVAVAPALRAQVTLTSPTVANITPTGFTAVWLTSDPTARPGIDIFSDAEGTTPFATPPRIEFTPLGLGNVEGVSTYDDRVERRALASLLAGRRLVYVHVSGLPAGAAVTFRPRTFDSSGVDDASEVAPLVSLGLTQYTAFVPDAAVLAVDFAGAGATGMVAVVQGPEGTVPLTAVIGDASSPDVAVFNMADLVSSAMQTNAVLAGPVDFTVSVLGYGAPGGTVTHTITFAADTPSVVPGRFDSFLFDSNFPSFFSFDSIKPQNAGLAFTVTVRALKADGTPLTTYAGVANISGSAEVASGAGDTTAFVAGVLSNYPVRIDNSGSFTLTATRGAATGASNAFLVKGNFGSWRNGAFDAAGLANAAVSGPQADPGGVGVANLLRYALGQAGPGFDAMRLPAPGVLEDAGSTYLSVTFDRLPSADDLSYRVEASSDLAAWTLVRTVSPGTPTTMTVSDVVPFSVDTKRYMRVLAVQQTSFAGYLNNNMSLDARSNPALVTDTADPGSTGIPNLLRYAFDLNYTAPAMSQLPAVGQTTVGGQNYVTLTFHRRSEGANVRYLVQGSSNLVSWTTIQTITPGVPTTMTVRDTVPTTVSVPRHLRIVVQRTDTLATVISPTI